MKLTPKESATLEDIRRAAKDSSDGVVCVNTALYWPAMTSGWSPTVHANSGTLNSLERKGKIKNLNQFWKGATCEVVV